MSKRNFILLILVLSAALVTVLGLLYLREEPADIGDEGTGTNFFAQFNPFGSSGPVRPDPKPPTDVSGYVPPKENTQTGKLIKVSSMPIAGYGIFVKERLKEEPIAPLLDEEGAGGGNDSVPPRPLGTPPKIGGEETKKPAPKTEFVAAIRYVEKEKGLVYQTFADKIEERKFSKTVIPRVHDAYFDNKAESVVMRYLKADGITIESFLGTLPKERLGDTFRDNEIKGSFLPDNVKDLSVAPDGSRIFYIFPAGGSGDTLVGSILNFSTGGKTQVFDSAFTEWLSHWGSNNNVTLTTKASSVVSGYAYSLDITKKTLSKALGGISGLTTLASPNGKLILYADGNLSLSIYHTDTRTSDSLALRSLPEKCVWGGVSDTIYCAVPKSPQFGNYPDSWYQGETSFDDQIWKIDVKTANASIIVDPKTETGREELDAIRLSLDEGENYLFFINKKDNFLWKIDLK